MKRLFSGRRIVRVALVGVLVLGLVTLAQVGQAQTSSTMSKRARKVQRTLSHYPAGAHLHLIFRDHTDRFGTLGAVSSRTFIFTDADNNAPATIAYENVRKVKKGAETIGAHSSRFSLW